MKPIATLFTAALVAVPLFTSAALADPLEGVWQTETNAEGYAHVRIAPCGAALCGTIISEFSTDGTQGEGGYGGKQIVHDMIPQGDGSYKGSVTDPTKDRTYTGGMKLNGNTSVQLKGCVAGGLFCAKQNWKRVN